MPRTLAEAARRLKPAHTRGGHPLPRLWIVSDPARLPDPSDAIAHTPSGGALLWRPYGMSAETVEAVGSRLRQLTRARRMTLVVAGDPRLALRTNADGLHLPEHLARHGCLAPILLWRRHKRWCLTVACHGVMALTRARVARADAVVISPAFPTASHPGAPALGPSRFAALARHAGRPVIALGGLTARSSARLPPTTVSGLAAVGAWSPPKPR